VRDNENSKSKQQTRRKGNSEEFWGE
jgi:hypothetical protein